ncbi:protein CTLA-2-alpha-like isoform X2 [Anoplophora glabripennis]|uniref:protein CTLA-2-alpha-like isoform X2 n=1 Tax=Anoplophora glabripennis TaxID=217634 RepID=UPI000874D708|nr:protein CTLA-2-alpha-like isoform X2 [Anoplophora glabripennis]
MILCFYRFTLLVITMAQLTLEEKWTSFKNEHGKSYEAEEEAKRFAIFQENVKKIEEHNKKYDAGEVTYKQGINNFSDLTPEEFKKFSGGFRIPN